MDSAGNFQFSITRKGRPLIQALKNDSDYLVAMVLVPYQSEPIEAMNFSS